jgi:predicted secreted protein
MNWVSGLVLYILLWWVSLFAVLPIGTHAVQQPDEATGWRGAPAAPRLLRKVLITTVVAGVAWVASYALITSDLISFREGFFAIPKDRGF